MTSHSPGIFEILYFIFGVFALTYLFNKRFMGHIAHVGNNSYNKIYFIESCTNFIILIEYIVYKDIFFQFFSRPFKQNINLFL